MKTEYNHLAIEKKWQKEWAKKKAYKTQNNFKKKKYYVLDMFPYPSGTGLHVGHPKGYIGSDVFARMKRAQGFNVLHPMGYDAFGLPAEQYALEHNIHPRKAVLENTKTFEKQLSIIGLSYDWDRKVDTTDPHYYEWTQWIFLKIYNSWYNKDTDKGEPIEKLVAIFEKSGNTKVNAASSEVSIFSAAEWKSRTEKEKQDILMRYRLAYEGYSNVNWCPVLGTVLANDEIVDGPKGPVSERGGYPVVQKEMRQWFMRITAYADRLLSGLETLNWPENIKEIQKNWIGKSMGVEIDFQAGPEKIRVFTTRPDTIFGATFLVISPELASKWFEIGWKAPENIKTYVRNALAERIVAEENKNREKTGVYAGFDAINPANQEKIPIWIADYVLGNYGTGAIMAVPADDERDMEFAEKYKLPIKNNYTPAKFQDFGKKIIRYKIRDAIFARQRYWGEPIPLTTDKKGIIHELAKNKLPLKLPEVKSYMPTGTGESPLAGVAAWVKKGLETNTMPGWAGSSWYFLRYMDPKNKKVFADKKAIQYWKNVDMYVGGAEHATGHLLYSRFWHKFLKDYGLVVTEEPFQTLRNQGLILGTDNRKMSKRWGNVVNPSDVVNTYGADTLRVYEMFMGPFDGSLPWSTDNIIGSRRFIERVWKTSSRVSKKAIFDPKLETLLHKTIKKVTEDIETFSFNTAVSSMMILLNEIEKSEAVNQKSMEVVLKLFSPFAPHVTEEMWHAFGHKTLLVLEAWPKFDLTKLVDQEVKIVIQVNGKMRGDMTVAKDTIEEEVLGKARSLPDIEKWLIGKVVHKTIFIQNKLVNFVVS